MWCCFGSMDIVGFVVSTSYGTGDKRTGERTASEGSLKRYEGDRLDWLPTSHARSQRESLVNALYPLKLSLRTNSHLFLFSLPLRCVLSCSGSGIENRFLLTTWLERSLWCSYVLPFCLWSSRSIYQMKILPNRTPLLSPCSTWISQERITVHGLFQVWILLIHMRARSQRHTFRVICKRWFVCY